MKVIICWRSDAIFRPVTRRGKATDASTVTALFVVTDLDRTSMLPSYVDLIENKYSYTYINLTVGLGDIWINIALS